MHTTLPWLGALLALLLSQAAAGDVSRERAEGKEGSSTAAICTSSTRVALRRRLLTWLLRPPLLQAPPQCLYAGAAGISLYGADMKDGIHRAASAVTCCFLCAVRLPVGSSTCCLPPPPRLAKVSSFLVTCTVHVHHTPCCSPTSCQPQELPRCVAFEWNPRDGGTCYLKDGSGAVPRVWEGAQIGALVTPGSLITPHAIASNNAAAAGAVSLRIRHVRQ